MRIQIANNELFIELDEKDLINLSQKYLIEDKFKFSILDDEMHITLKKTSVVPRIKTLGLAGESALDNNKFNYN